VRRRGAALGLVATLLVAGCAVPPPPPGDPHVVIVPGAGVVADRPIVMVENDLLRVAVRLSDANAGDARVIAQIDWLDAAGRRVDTVMSAPRRMVVPGMGDAWVRGVAPNADVGDFRLHVAPDLVGNP
jgi:uncharacterized protein YcfL